MDSDEGATARRTERRRRLLGYAALGAALVLGAVLILVAAGFRSLDVAAYPLPVQRLTTWEEILARPRPVTVEVLLTGTVDGDRLVVLDESDPNIEELGDHHTPSTVSAYWVHHPTEGDYLIDAGLARAFAREGGNYTALLRLILALIGAENHSTDGADVASQLRSRGISPRAVQVGEEHGSRRPHLGARRPPRSSARGVRARRSHVHAKGDDWRPPRRQAPLRVGLRQSSRAAALRARTRSARRRLDLGDLDARAFTESRVVLGQCPVRPGPDHR